MPENNQSRSRHTSAASGLFAIWLNNPDLLATLRERPIPFAAINRLYQESDFYRNRPEFQREIEPPSDYTVSTLVCLFIPDYRQRQQLRTEVRREANERRRSRNITNQTRRSRPPGSQPSTYRGFRLNSYVLALVIRNVAALLNVDESVIVPQIARDAMQAQASGRLHELRTELDRLIAAEETESHSSPANAGNDDQAGHGDVDPDDRQTEHTHPEDNPDA